MAFTASAVARVRAGGNAANGAFYDATISGAGTDYTQQDASQLSLSDLTSTNSTTITSVTGGFTAAMIGNALHINSGTGATVAFYFITARTDTNTITVDRVSGTYTLGVGRVGGAAAKVADVGTASNSTGNKAAPGNIVYIHGSGTGSSASPDYTQSSTFGAAGGDNTTGKVTYEGVSNPFIKASSTSELWNNLPFCTVRGISFTAASSTTRLISPGQADTLIENCYFDLANIAAAVGAYLTARTTIRNCEIYGGTASPSFSSGSYGVVSDGQGNAIVGCRIHHCRDTGIFNNNSSYGPEIQDNTIDHNAGDGISLQDVNTVRSQISGNVIDANALNGIKFTAQAAVARADIWNNVISNHTTSAKAGILVTSGTTATSDRQRGFIDYNAVYNNTANYSGISAGSHDVACSVSPYTSAGTDYTLNNTAGGGASLRDGGFPQVIPGLASTDAYQPIGFNPTPSGGSGGVPSFGIAGPLFRGVL